MSDSKMLKSIQDAAERHRARIWPREPLTPRVSERPVPQLPRSNDQTALTTENNRLRERVKELETENQRLKEQLAAPRSAPVETKKPEESKITDDVALRFSLLELD